MALPNCKAPGKYRGVYLTFGEYYHLCHRKERVSKKYASGALNINVEDNDLPITSCVTFGLLLNSLCPSFHIYVKCI